MPVKKKPTAATRTRRKKVDPTHGVKIQLMYQLMNIRGKNLIDKWKHLYSRSAIYEWAAKPFNGNVLEDKRKHNSGRPPKLTQRDERNILRSIPRLRRTKGHFTSFDVQNECGLTHLNNRIIRNCLNKNGVNFLRSRKKGILSLSDHKKRLSYCRKANKFLDEEFWTHKVSFYLDGKGFQYKTNPLDTAKAPHAREWRTRKQGLDYGCVAKGSKEGTRNANFMVAISYSKGVVLCEQYFGRITGQKFADIVHRCFPEAFQKSINPVTCRFVMDGCPRQNSRLAKTAISQVGGMVMGIPARSPDLNPIENFFGQVDRVLKQQAIDRNITHETFGDFSSRCKETMLTFDREKIDTLISSMAKRVKEVLKMKGRRINY